MTHTLEQVIDLVKNNFGFEPEIKYENDVLSIRVGGVDNVSLAKYIREKINYLKITVHEREGYKFSDMEWIKIEEQDKEHSQVVYTNGRNVVFY